MKKVILPFIISFIIMTITQYSFAATAAVNVTAVRIRQSASTDSDIVTVIYEDDEVEILEEAGEWYKVKYGENVGYAKAEFFTKKGEVTNNTVSNTTTNQVENEVSNTTDLDTNTTTATPTVDNTQVDEKPTTDPSENTEMTIQEPIVGDIITLQTSVKTRIIPSLTAVQKLEIAQDTTITIEAKLGNWYKISSEEISGWVTKNKIVGTQTVSENPIDTIPAPVPEEPTSEPVETEPEVPEFVQNTTPTENIVPNEPTTSTTNKTAIVIVETARVRSGASTTAGIIDVLDEDDIVTIIGEEGEFYKITCEKISSGYISKTLVKLKDVTSRSSAEERVSTENNSTANIADSTKVSGNDIVAFAKQYLGYKYVLGCSTPEKGFDCSGFTRYVYGHFGYKLGQVAANQTSLGAVVERENLQIGDLILFYNDGKTKIGHCGIYIGGGDFIHSANPQRGVVIDNLNTNSYYSQRFVTARRII